MLRLGLAVAGRVTLDFGTSRGCGSVAVFVIVGVGFRGTVEVVLEVVMVFVTLS